MRRRQRPSQLSNLLNSGSLPPDKARSMRITATALLVSMAGLFGVALHMEGAHPAWGFVLAFAEAAMVGGLADWFAVTALFRHPLGIPIPHTAIIPNNKNRIADTMAGFLKRNFLTPAVMARRMHNMNIAKVAGEFLIDRKSGGSGRVGAGAMNLFADLLQSLDPERMGKQVQAGLAKQVSKIEIAPLIGKMIEAAIAENRHRPLVDGAIRWAGLTLEDNEEMVRDMVQKRANALLRWTGLDGRLADSVLDGLYKLLAEILVDPHHPLRGKVEEGLAGLAHDLQHDDAMRAKIEGMKNDLLDNPALADWWMGVWESIRHSLLDTARNPDGALSGMLGASLAELGTNLRENPALQIQVNRLARRMIVGVSSRHGEQIVRLVSDTVKSWDASTVTNRIESAVGRDLQFIRVNGTMVGGLVGLIIHTVKILV